MKRFRLSNDFNHSLLKIDFKGSEMPSHIDGSLRQYFSSRTRTQRVYYSLFATAGLCLLVVGTVTGIYLMRFAIASDVGVSRAQTLASLLNAILIEVLNQMYSFFAEALSEWENHR
jgi:hypothetical protein